MQPAPKPFACWLLALAMLCFLGCHQSGEIHSLDPAFARFIESHTSGAVGKTSPIRVVLAGETSTTHVVGETTDEELFSISPRVKGKTVWVNARTVEFRPAEPLHPGRLYQVDFALGKVMPVEKRFREAAFSVQILPPSFEVNDQGLTATDREFMSYGGELLTADLEKAADVKKLLKASYNGEAVTIKWNHSEAAKSHQFFVTGLRRTAVPGTLRLTWNGSAIDARQQGSKEVTVPAKGDFQVLNIRAVQDDQQYLLVQFSELLERGQDVTGLISVSGQSLGSYSIRGSEARLYPSSPLEGSFSATVNEGIMSSDALRLAKTSVANVFFENRLPQVKMLGKGVILPGNGGRIVLPFEAVNLRAVDVSVIRIYETNIGQFLQQNQLDGQYNLRNVARPIARATIALDNDPTVDLSHKNRFALDLDKYVRTQPGAIYRVQIGFRKAYSVYRCAQGGDEQKDDNEEVYEEYEHPDLDGDNAFWDNYQYGYGYNWSGRNNPCDAAYYNGDRFATRNVLVTNIGLMAKRDAGNGLWVAATNLLTTDPLGDVQLKALDYQLQVIGTAMSNSDGEAYLPLKRKPYLLVASRGSEKSYLKLDEGSTLPLSRFDVGGAEVKQGIKGYIFGERGVWRPGDSLFLSLIVEDKLRNLPDGHPIEMELSTPQGQLYKRSVFSAAADGFNVVRTATDASAPTGNWLCRFKLGGAVFEKKLKIETVVPNRLKISLNLGGAKTLGKGSPATGTLSARWLFGAPARQLKARVDAQLYRQPTSFEGLDDFHFDDPTINYAPQTKTVFDGVLNDSGVATINAAFTPGERPPGMLLANLMVKVFEPGGGFSIDNTSYPYHPFNSYVGLRMPKGQEPWGFLEAGKPHTIDLLEVNTAGKRLGSNSLVQLEIYKLQWRWWWDESGDEFSNFTEDSYRKLEVKDSVRLSGGKASYRLNLPDAGYGRYLVLIKNTATGQTAGQSFYVDTDEWQTRADNGNASTAAMLSFSTSKPVYQMGEEVKLAIPGSGGGRALVSVENGTKVVHRFWVRTQQGQTFTSFKTTPAMSPNVFVHVTLLQPHAQTLNDLPLRMYGVVPVTIQDKNTLLHPTVQIAGVLRPETEASITVGEQNSHPMRYVIAVVDEGLLDLTRFKTPDPHEAFFAKEALGVKSWDLYDYVMGAWSGSLDRILTIGGDAEAALAAQTRKANRFPPMVKFMGPFTSRGGNQTHRFRMPAYIGSVRTMVIAAGDGAYGMAEKTAAVKSPLMLLPSLPRLVAPGEEIRMPVSLFSELPGRQQPTLQLSGNDFFDIVGPVVNNGIQQGEGLAYVTLRVKPKTGIAKISITARLGQHTARYQTELEVRNPQPSVTQVQDFTVQPGQTIRTQLTRIGTGAGSGATVELSSIPAIRLQQRLSYLVQYPHGCIEQTASAAFPQLVLNQLIELSPAQQKEVERNVKTAIQKIRNFQEADGGFGYWPGSGESDPWGTSYAGHFLLEAGRKGYQVPEALLQSWQTYQQRKAQGWNVREAPGYGGDLDQAYRLYLLALAKAPELGAMNRLREYRFLSPEGKWMLAAAYYLAGQQGLAQRMVSSLPTQLKQPAKPGMSYGSQERDEAIVLQTLSLMNQKAQAQQVLRRVAARLSSDQWYSTQTTAYSLLAIAEYCGTHKTGERIKAQVSAGSQKASLSTASAVTQQTVVWQNGQATVQVTNQGSNVLYLRVINQGQPTELKPMPAVGSPDVLQLGLEFLTTGGQPIAPGKLSVGTDFVAKVTVYNPGNRGVYEQMALSQFFPGGWEILNTRLFNSEGSFTSSPSQYMDIRDDKVHHYFNLAPGETRTYYVQLNAAYQGRYFWPGVYAEAMYQHQISASLPGAWVEVGE